MGGQPSPATRGDGSPRNLLLRSQFRRDAARMNARFGARPGGNSIEPRTDILERSVEGLADGAAEIQEAIERDVGEREAIATNPLLTGDQTIEPHESLACNRLEITRCGGNHVEAILEDRDAFAVAEAIGQWPGDGEIDTSRPHTRLGFFFGVAADQRWIR